MRRFRACVANGDGGQLTVVPSHRVFCFVLGRGGVAFAAGHGVADRSAKNNSSTRCLLEIETYPVTTIVDADKIVYVCAAASVVRKLGFAGHVGYCV